MDSRLPFYPTPLSKHPLFNNRPSSSSSSESHLCSSPLTPLCWLLLCVLVGILVTPSQSSISSSICDVAADGPWFLPCDLRRPRHRRPFLCQLPLHEVRINPSQIVFHVFSLLQICSNMWIILFQVWLRVKENGGKFPLFPYFHVSAISTSFLHHFHSWKLWKQDKLSQFSTLFVNRGILI